MCVCVCVCVRVCVRVYTTVFNTFLKVKKLSDMVYDVGGSMGQWVVGMWVSGWVRACVGGWMGVYIRLLLTPV